MQLWTLVSAPLLGELGATTRLAPRTPCATCGMMPPLEAEHLAYRLDYWDGQPLFHVAQQYVVTPALRDALSRAGLTGMTFAPMDAELVDDFADPEQPSLPLPAFLHLKITSTSAAGPGWWDPAGACDACGQALWRDNPSSFDAPYRGHSDPTLPRRTVRRATYRGQDVLRLDDRGPAVISQAFRDVLEREGVTGLAFQAVDVID